jgi:tetratricopeptide (TPR) repeat protein
MTAENSLVQPKHVILLVCLGMALILITAVIYRLTHPNLTVALKQPQQQQQQSAPSSAEHGGEQDMTAIRDLMSKMRESPDDPEVLKALGREFMHMQAWEQAKGFLERAVMNAPSDVEALMMLGVNLFNMQNHQEAAEQFELVLSLDPDNVMARYNLGIINKYGLENPEKARDYFNQVLESENVSDQIRKQAAAELEEL